MAQRQISPCIENRRNLSVRRRSNPLLHPTGQPSGRFAYLKALRCIHESAALLIRDLLAATMSTVSVERIDRNDLEKLLPLAGRQLVLLAQEIVSSFGIFGVDDGPNKSCPCLLWNALIGRTREVYRPDVARLGDGFEQPIAGGGRVVRDAHQRRVHLFPITPLDHVAYEGFFSHLLAKTSGLYVGGNFMIEAPISCYMVHYRYLFSCEASFSLVKSSQRPNHTYNDINSNILSSYREIRAIQKFWKILRAQFKVHGKSEKVRITKLILETLQKYGTTR